MATGTKADFTIYHEEYFSGMYESIVQNVNAFNAASGGAITRMTDMVKGDYEKRTFLKTISNLVSRRDITSTSAATVLKMTQGQIVGVKLNRKVGPIKQTADAWRKIDEDPVRMSYYLGRMAGEEIVKDQLNQALRAVETALHGQSNVEYDYSGTGTLAFAALNNGLALFGDKAESIRVFVMHSKAFYNLVGDGIANYKIDTIAGMMIATGSAAAMGRVIVVTDCDALKQYELAYDGQTGNFGVNLTATGGTSGATGTIIKDTDAGATGTLEFDSVTGTWADNEAITDTVIGAATVNGTLTTKYATLGLVPGAVTVKISEQKDPPYFEREAGNENLEYQYQDEYAYNVEVLGFTWDVSNGGANPTQTALAIPTNWDKVVTEDKNLAGIRIVTT